MDERSLAGWRSRDSQFSSQLSLPVFYLPLLLLFLLLLCVNVPPPCYDLLRPPLSRRLCPPLYYLHPLPIFAFPIFLSIFLSRPILILLTSFTALWSSPASYWLCIYACTFVFECCCTVFSLKSDVDSTFDAYRQMRSESTLDIK